MADIYLKYLKDRRNFAKCYIELIEVKFIKKANPTYENYKLLGRALVNI